ncbi:hypothetical protein Taro_006094 [Colocasia esculenta]|uniref:X8 domain-containing protein n=1 Tax=Colocasia esculenta TaxID=4460 RepID=A0A843TQ30_COLES|nr:hypothetical protein [Colocasia esculenta]
MLVTRTPEELVDMDRIRSAARGPHRGATWGPHARPIMSSAAQLIQLILIIRRTWCIARDVAEPQALQSNIDYACSKVECSIILPGGSCFCPNTLMNHASVAMNLYYKANKRNPSACNFNGTGTITFTDPSKHSTLCFQQ